MMVPKLPTMMRCGGIGSRMFGTCLTYFYEYFPEDSWLIEKYVCPMYDAFATPSRRQSSWELPFEARP